MAGREGRGADQGRLYEIQWAVDGWGARRASGTTTTTAAATGGGD